MIHYPIPLYPAFRHGKDTPWGGDQLRKVFHKDIPDDHTGESLEMSVIPGLNATDAEGVGLRALIDREPVGMCGSEVAEPFPLLLKLIDAQNRLSVQVHPDDAYASLHENKLGKTEAWVILRAEPGAQLVYGIKEGVTREALEAACQNGRAIEDLLRFVPVHEGDVFYIPAGTVHAIGAGILLYEIQQSSDITYRFYDWDRTDAQGNKRALHIRQALDVTRLDLQMDAAKAVPIPDATCRREQLLDTDYFALQRLSDCLDTPFIADKKHFSVLTLLTDGVLRSDSFADMALPAGQTIFLPADCAPFTLTCGACMVASPANKKGQ